MITKLLGLFFIGWLCWGLLNLLFPEAAEWIRDQIRAISDRFEGR